MAPHAAVRSAWAIPAGLYLFALAVNLVGIGWGLPGQGGHLLPPAPSPEVGAAADRSWGDVRDPGRDLNFGPPDPDQTETFARTFRRFALYTADPDEQLAIMAVARLNPLRGRWDPGISQYGGLFLYALGASLKGASVLRLVSLRADPSFYVTHPEAMGRIYLVGRLMVALVGALAIPLVWALARPHYGPGLSLLSALTVGLAPAWIVWSHVLKPHAFGTPFALAALLAGRRLASSPRPRRDAAGAGALAGLAAGAALPFGAVLLAPWIGIGLRPGERAARRLAWMALAAGGAAAAFFAFQPYWLLAPVRTVTAWQRAAGWYLPDYRPAALGAFVWGTLGGALGLPLAILALAEAGILAWGRREVLPVIAATFALLLAIAIKTGGLPGDALHARIVLPAVLVLAMLAVGCLGRIGRALPRAVRWLPAILVFPTLVLSAGLLRTFLVATGDEDTRHRAGAWINTLPPGASLGVLAPLAPFRSPYFRFDRYHVMIDPQPDRGGRDHGPEYFLVAERSDLPVSLPFSARYREVARFLPPHLPLGLSTFAVYRFADPPIHLYSRRGPAGGDGRGVAGGREEDAPKEH